MASLFGTLCRKFAASPAKKAWNHGCPQAQSVHEARHAWTAFLPEWTTMLERANTFVRATPNGESERLGWVNEPHFWKAFWDVWREDLSLLTLNHERACAAIGAYVEGASAAASHSFFATAPQTAAPLIGRVLLDTHVVLDPLTMGSLPMALQGTIQRGIEHRQLVYVLGLLQWASPNSKAKRHSVENVSLAHGRGTLSMADEVALVVRLGRAYFHTWPNNTSIGKEDQTHLWRNAFGYLLCNQPKHVERHTLIRCIQKTMGEDKPFGLDLPLMALCSGYEVMTAPRATEVAAVGAYLAGGGQSGGDNAPLALQTLDALGAIDSMETLYEASVQMGLHLEPEESMTVDAELFTSTSP